MFSMLPLSNEQILAMREKHGIYMAGSGRINVAGLTMGNMTKFVAALAAVHRLNLDRQPVLDGERLLLRPLTRADWDALFAIASDPLMWEKHPAHDRWQEPVFRAFFDDALAKGGALAIVDKASGGGDRLVALPELDRNDRGEVEIGWSFLAAALLGRRLQRAR